MNEIEENLIRRLEMEFGNIELPRENQILLSTTKANDVEAGNVKEFFSGKRWNEITLDQLFDQYKSDPSASLLFMSPIAFRYYLPLFIKICISDYDDADLIYETTIWRLLPSKSHLSSHEFNKLYDEYDLEKKSLIADILQYLSVAHIDDFGENNDARLALDEWWNKYLIH